MALSKGKGKSGNVGDKFTPPNAQQSPDVGAQPHPGPGPQRKSQAQPGQASPPRPNRGRPGLLGFNRQVTRPISRRSTSETLQRYKQVFEELLAPDHRQPGHEDDPFKMLTLDNEQMRIGPVSSLLLVLLATDEQGNHFATVHTMLVESSTSTLPPATWQIDGRNISVDQVVGDVYTQYYWENVADFVRRSIGTDLTVEDAGVIVLPTTLDPEDDLRMHKVIYHATQACATVMHNALQSEEALFNVSMIDSQQERLVNRLSYATPGDPSSGQTESATGHPIRSSVRVTLEAQPQNQHQSAIPQPNMHQPMPLTSVDAYVDVGYYPPQLLMNQQGFQPHPGQHITQTYLPKIIITRADSATDAVTSELQIMAIAQVALLAKNRAWAEQLRPQFGGSRSGVDFTDIGALGHELDLRGKGVGSDGHIDTHSNDFDFQQFIQMAFHDRPVYEMDIEETGELSWIHHAFVAAANGDSRGYNLIYQAADALCLGHFSSVFPAGEICWPTNNRVHLGYYYDKESGMNRDLRDLDYIAVRNAAADKDPDLMVKWCRSWYDVQIPEPYRLAERREVISHVLGNRVTITGYAQRIRFNPDWLNAILIGLAKADVRISPQNLMDWGNGGGVRADMAAYAAGFQANNMANVFAFHQPYGNWQGGPGFMGRFGHYPG